ncbi:MAG: flagellar M-ring protein FliF [Deltaproteobacteria bacterium]|nr:flagellar M-ring protein FliF [Deltaproteobacteria bacterium]
MAEEKKSTNLLDAVAAWPWPRKISLLLVALISIAVFTVIILQFRATGYGLLYANLPEGDASIIVEWLKERKIPYQLEGNGSSILIPTGQVHETRLGLAGAGLPRGGGIGFEVFDKQSFGMTDFAQKINYQRALQGELARTITALEPVAAARVHIAMAEKRLFRNQQKETTASVTLKLKGGEKLQEKQIRGIVNLVAGSIQGLSPENVTIVDDRGRILTKATGEGEEGPLSPEKLVYQQTFERRLEERAQSMLDMALGRENSLVKVTAELDFSQSEKTEERYDPTGSVPRSEQTTEEKGGTETLSGVPGVQSNLRDGKQGLNFIPSSKTSEITNYEVSRVVNHVKAPMGVAKKISVSVLVADRPNPEADAAGAKDAAPLFLPRSEKEMSSIEGMVKSAVGFDPQRGDQIRVVSMPFGGEFTSDLPTGSPIVDKVYPFLPMVKYLLLAAIAGLAYLLLVRPLIRTLKAESQKVDHYKTVEQLEAEMSGRTLLQAPADPVQRIRQNIISNDDNNQVTSRIIKSWLKEE